MHIFDLNQTVRIKLSKIYNNFRKNNDIDEAKIKYLDFINDLRLENEKLYLYIISLAYLDNYSLELYNKKNNIEIYENIHSLDDLLFNLNNGDLSIDDFIFASLKIANKNLNKKAILLNLLDNNYIKLFNHYYLIEKYNMFSDKDMAYLICEYQKIIKSNQEEYEILKAKGVSKVLDIINVQLFNNRKNYYKLICEFLLVFYKIKKYLKNCRNNILFEMDEVVIELIEKKDIDEIMFVLSKDSDLLSLIIEDVIDYETIDTVIDKNDVENYFNNKIKEEVKIKLKEV